MTASVEHPATATPRGDGAAPTTSIPVRHLTVAELEAAHLAAGPAPRQTGTVDLLVRRPEVGARETLPTAVLDPALGLVGDDWVRRPSRRSADGEPHPDMQVALIATRVIDALAAGRRDRWALAGDQLVVDLDLSPAQLGPGSRLGIGDVVLEVTDQPHTGCAKLAAHFGRDALRWLSTPQARAANLRGLYTRVVTGGTVTTGQAVHVRSRA